MTCLNFRFHHIAHVPVVAIHCRIVCNGGVGRYTKNAQGRVPRHTCLAGSGGAGRGRVVNRQQAQSCRAVADLLEAGHLNRLIIALRAFWLTLTDPDFAARVEPLFSRAPTGPDLRVLAVLQRDGRLVDFLEEEIDALHRRPDRRGRPRHPPWLPQVAARLSDDRAGHQRGRGRAGHDPDRFRPGRDPTGRQRQRLTALSGRAQASWLAGPLGPPAALARGPRRSSVLSPAEVEIP